MALAQTQSQAAGAAAPSAASCAIGRRSAPAMGILAALSLSHMLNDMVQSVASSMYPTFRETYGLSFLQLGLVTLAFQGTASILQPIVGYATDRRPVPLALPGAMVATFIGIVAFSLTTRLSPAAGFGGDDRRRQRDFPPRGLARRALRVGRAPRLGAEPVPTRRQFRPGDRSAAGRADRHALRAKDRADVRRARADLDGAALPRQPMAAGARQGHGRAAGAARAPTTGSRARSSSAR